MKTFAGTRMLGFATIIVALATAPEARAGLLTFSNADESLPITAGNGLLANYYRPTGGFQAGTISSANSYVGSQGTDATFVSTGINYAAGTTYGSGATIGDSTPLSTYLGSDANSLVATAGSPSGETTTQVLANTLDGTIYKFTGYLAISASQVNTVQSFYLGSDDGSALYIQGQQVIANDGDHSFGFTDGGNTVTFAQAGLYAVTILYYEDAGATGVEFGSTLAGTGAFGGELTATNFYQALSNAVPEPSSLLLLGMAGAIVGGFRGARARRRAA